MSARINIKQRIIAAVMIFWAILLIIMPLYSIYRGPITISPYVRYIVTIWPSDNGEGNVGWAYIYDNKTDTYYSFLHYAHISGKAKEPVKKISCMSSRILPTRFILMISITLQLHSHLIISNTPFMTMVKTL